MSSPGTDNLIFWHEMDEASGDRLDGHGSHDAEDNNTVGAGSNDAGDGANFEADFNEYFLVPDHDDLDIGDNPYSWGFFYEPESTGRQFFTHKYHSGDADGYSFEYNGGTFYLFHRNDSGAAETGLANAMTAGNTYFIGWTYNNSTNLWELWINGASIGTASMLRYPKASSQDLNIGRRPTGSHIDGVMNKHFFFHDQILTSDEWLWLYNSGDGRVLADLAGGGGAGQNSNFLSLMM